MKFPFFALAAGATLALSASAGAEEAPRRLYPGRAPGSEAWTRPETVAQRPDGALVYTNVRDPELTTHRPAPGRANGSAVILLPGGGLRVLSVGQENKDLIQLFTERGVTVFVLKYRILQAAPTPPAPAASGPLQFPKLVIRNANANPAPDDLRLNEVLRFAVHDAQTALRMVRADAKAQHIDPSRVGFVGSSAGGGVAIGTLLANAPGATPDFIVSLYGPALQDVVVPPQAPPLFIATETPHGPVTDGLVELFGLWKDANRPVELHVFDVPNFAMPVSLFETRLVAFLAQHQIIDAAAD